jgi:hypothetical protein
MHRNNQDMMVYSLSLAPRQLQSLAGLEHGREHSIGGYGPQFRFARRDPMISSFE